MSARQLLLAILLLALPAAATAQSDRPRRGKIDGVEREARSDSSRGGGDDGGEGGFWAMRLAADLAQAMFATPKFPGQGYLPYPYALHGDGAPSFVLKDVARERRFGTLTVGRFDDVSSTLRGSAFAFEGANDVLHYALAYTHYREPKATEIDHLHAWRLGFSGAPRLGRVGYARIGVGGRGLVLDDGTAAGGADLELAAQLFPVRPLGLHTTFRIGGMSWSGGSSFLVTELDAGGSVFIGRVEVRGGWHWLKLGGATAFGGPIVSTRLWF